MKVMGEEKIFARIERQNPHQSLGVKLLGGYLTRDDSVYGIFVRDVGGSSAAAVGELQEGDLIVEIAGEYIGNCRSDSVALAKMTRCFEDTGCLEIVIARSDNLRCEFLNILAMSVLEREDLMQEETQRLYSTHSYRAAMLPSSGLIDTRTATHRATLDSNSRIRVEKLEVSLQYLGVSMSLTQQERLRERLRIDPDGTVKYSDFVQTVNQIMKEDGRTPVPAARMTPELKEKMKVETEKLRKEVASLKELLQEKEIACGSLEEEVLRMRREIAAVVSECRSLKKKSQEAEVAKEQAACMEKDYQQVISLLETEMSEMKKKTQDDQDDPLVQQRMAVLGCQIRKAETGRKAYRASTDRLLAFARVVHASLAPESQDFTTKRLTPHQIGEEAGVVLEDVKKLLKLDEDELPFAWEEAFTEEGEKYYVNR